MIRCSRCLKSARYRIERKHRPYIGSDYYACEDHAPSWAVKGNKNRYYKASPVSTADKDRAVSRALRGPY